MVDFINANILKDSSTDTSKKYKGTIYLKKDCYIKIESLISLTESTSRNDVIEKAVAFYFGFISSQLSQEFLCSTLGSKMEGLLGTLGTRIARGNFRSAVETDMLTRMLASVVHVSGPEYNKLRRRSIDEVKRTNGAIDILQAVEDAVGICQKDE